MYNVEIYLLELLRVSMRGRIKWRASFRIVKKKAAPAALETAVPPRTTYRALAATMRMIMASKREKSDSTQYIFIRFCHALSITREARVRSIASDPSRMLLEIDHNLHRILPYISISVQQTIL